MCLTFIFINDNPAESKYRLILANNRDELWDRPTKPLSCWGDDLSIFSAQDQQPGSEGGTWLGMSKEGKIGILNNVLGPTVPGKKSRGSLVNDFLTSPFSGTEYIEQVVSPHGQEYGSFHLILLDLSGKQTHLCHFSNMTSDTMKLEDDGICALGNSVSPNKPWKKCQYGRDVFASIVHKHQTKDGSSEEIIADLHKMLSDKTRHGIDDVLLDQGKSAGFGEDRLSALSSVFVQYDKRRYGTRTHSFILVNHSGHVEFCQMTLKSPVDPGNFQWQTDVEHFVINNSTN